MGFPLHQGTVEAGPRHLPLAPRPLRPRVGLHPRPLGRRRRGFDVDIDGDDVFVTAAPTATESPHLAAPVARRPRGGHLARDREVGARAARAGVEPAEIVRTGIDFGTRYRAAGWGAGLTVLVAMANLLPHLDPTSEPLALVHGLVVRRARHRDQPPRFPVAALATADVPTGPARRSGTGASSRPVRATRPSACSPPRSPKAATSHDVER